MQIETKFGLLVADADGWIDAPEGGYPENPVPGRTVHALLHYGNDKVVISDTLTWAAKSVPSDIKRWRLAEGDQYETLPHYENGKPAGVTVLPVDLQTKVAQPIIPAEERLAADIRAAAQVFDALLAQAEQTGIRVTIRQGEGAFRLGSPDIVKVL